MNAMGIKLSRRVLNHILTRHPEMKPHIEKIGETASSPDMIIRGLRGELKALKFYSMLHTGSKYIIAVYREIHGEKVIITAYLTSDANKVKGEIVWTR